MTLTGTDLFALLPVLLVLGTALAVLVSVAVSRQHFVNATITVVGLNAALVSLLLVLRATPESVTDLVVIDDYTVLYTALILVASLACSTLAHAYLDGYPGRREEFYMLLLTAVAGGIILAASQHLAALFIGLELLSVPLYGMAAYTYRDHRSLEAGLKYMVLSAAASAFLLFGMALLYAATGTLQISELGAAIDSGVTHRSWLVIGTGMMVIAIAFKLSLVPFHLWTPDVYEGAPAPAAAFLATVGKVAVFAVLVRLFQSAPATADATLHQMIAALALISMIAGNLLALRQNNLKRLLGYSSIAHMGYITVAIVATGSLAVEAAGMYLITYVLATLGAFGVLTLVSSPYDGTDAGAVHNYRGLFWRRPYLAAVMTVMMLSLAGIPSTAGFIGKFYVIALGVQSELWWLVGGIVMGSAIGLYYYLRVMVVMYLFEPGERRRDAAHDWGQRSGGIMVLLIALAVMGIGLFPQPLIRLVEAAGLGSG